MAPPPWWILQGVKPAGEKDMGTWKAVAFTEEQQAQFHINEDGAIQDQEKHDAAIAAFKASATATSEASAEPAVGGPMICGAGGAGIAPWWIRKGIKPEVEKDMGTWKASAFSEAQQAQFYVDEDGKVLDQENHDAAIVAFQAAAAAPEAQPAPVGGRMMCGAGGAARTPWWIQKGVKPAGEKDMGSWKAIAFSEEQQAQFHIDEDGTIKDQAKHDAAIAEFQAAETPEASAEPTQATGRPMCGAGGAGRPPWWILKGVKPEGPEKDMGSWKAISFSAEQQEQFGIDDSGKILDQAKFDAAIAAKGA